MTSLQEKLSAVQALERQIKAGSQLPSSEIDMIQLQLRDAYVEIMQMDVSTTQARDLDQSLWKSVFYRNIEEFRQQLKTSARAKTNTSHQRIIGEFAAFLNSASQFYLNLVAILQNHHDIPGYVPLSQLTLDAPPPSSGPSPRSESIYRCLVFLGDIARYKEMHAFQSSKAFHEASAYYDGAILLDPSNGSAYNQLAVISTYKDDVLGSAYNYVRSMMTASPFATAEGNLDTFLSKVCNKGSLSVQSQAPSGGNDGIHAFLAIICDLRSSQESFSSLARVFFDQHLLPLLRHPQSEQVFQRLSTIVLFVLHQARLRSTQDFSSSCALKFAIQFFYRLVIAMNDEGEGVAQTAGLLSLKLLSDYLLSVHGVVAVLQLALADEFERFWPSFAFFLNSLNVKEPSKSNILAGKWSQVVALWEDVELLGFSPLKLIHRCKIDHLSPSLSSEDQGTERSSGILSFAVFLMKQEPERMHHNGSVFVVGPRPTPITSTPFAYPPSQQVSSPALTTLEHSGVPLSNVPDSMEYAPSTQYNYRHGGSNESGGAYQPVTPPNEPSPPSSFTLSHPTPPSYPMPSSFLPFASPQMPYSQLEPPREMVLPQLQDSPSKAGVEDSEDIVFQPRSARGSKGQKKTGNGMPDAKQDLEVTQAPWANTSSQIPSQFTGMEFSASNWDTTMVSPLPNAANPSNPLHHPFHTLTNPLQPPTHTLTNPLQPPTPTPTLANPIQPPSLTTYSTLEQWGLAGAPLEPSITRTPPTSAASLASAWLQSTDHTSTSTSISTSTSATAPTPAFPSLATYPLGLGEGWAATLAAPVLHSPRSLGFSGSAAAPVSSLSSTWTFQNETISSWPTARSEPETFPINPLLTGPLFSSQHRSVWSDPSASTNMWTGDALWPNFPPQPVPAPPSRNPPPGFGSTKP